MNDMKSKNNIISSVILSGAKNLGNIRLAHTRSFTTFRMTRSEVRKASVLCTLCSVLLISSCTHDEITPPVNTTNDALALLPGDTRVGVSAELKDESEKMTVSRAEGDESATTYYALKEIHASKDVEFIMFLPGASDENKRQLSMNSILFKDLATTELFSTLMLKDFNLTEGNGRCVSRWTLLNASSGGIDNLWGWARLTADATTGQPVLDYAMQRGNAKVTIVVQDENGQPVDVSGDKVTATVSLPNTFSEVIYTPEGETAGKQLNYYLLYEVKTLADDDAIDPDRIALGTYAIVGTENSYFNGMVTTDGTGGYYYGEQSNTLTGIVSATATHTTDNITFTPIADGPQFTDADKLTITVNTDPDGDGPQTTGTYSLKLSEVKLSDTKYLTALEPGKHYTLTVTLRHNTLVAATATIGAWSTASASANIGGDGAKLPSYTYDAETNTYTILEDAGIEKALADRTANNRTDAAVVSKVPTLAVVNGAETNLSTVQAAIAGKTHIIVTGTELAAYGEGTSLPVVGTAIRNRGAGAAYGTINLILPEVTAIWGMAFEECHALTSVSLPSATTIGQEAFSNCTAITSVSLPSAITIGQEAFEHCPALTSVSAPVATTIGQEAFSNCFALTSVSLPSATLIGDGAFTYTPLTTVSLPSATSIGDGAFMFCDLLTSLTFGSVIENVGTDAFKEITTENCDLTLAAGQASHATYPAEAGENKTWAGKTWKSITLK